MSGSRGRGRGRGGSRGGRGGSSVSVTHESNPPLQDFGTGGIRHDFPPAPASSNNQHRPVSPTQQLVHFPPSYHLLMSVWRDPDIGPEFHQLIAKYRQHQQQRFHQSPSSLGAMGALRIIHQDVLLHHLVQLFLDDDSARDLAFTNRTFFELLRERYQLRKIIQWAVVPLQGLLTRTSRPTHKDFSRVDFCWTQSHTEHYVLDRAVDDAGALVVMNHNPSKLTGLAQVCNVTEFIHKDSRLQSKRRFGLIQYLDLELSPPYRGDRFPIDCCLINLTFVPETVVRLKMRCSLRFEPSYNVGGFYWPKSLHTLELSGYSMEIFSDGMLTTWPVTLQKLTLGQQREVLASQPPERHIYLPPTVTDLDLQCVFSPRELSSYVHFPPKLRRLHYGSLHSSLSDLHLSDEVCELTLGSNYNSPIDGWQLPKHLKKLVFGGQFNRSLAGVIWNNELTYLEVGHDFAQDVTQIKFPDSLKPENITRLQIGLFGLSPRPLLPITSTIASSSTSAAADDQQQQLDEMEMLDEQVNKWKVQRRNREWHHMHPPHHSNSPRE